MTKRDEYTVYRPDLAPEQVAQLDEALHAQTLTNTDIAVSGSCGLYLWGTFLYLLGPQVGSYLLAAMIVSAISLILYLVGRRHFKAGPLTRLRHERLLSAHEGQWVCSKSLGSQARDLLERACRARETVLGSNVHRAGTLADPIKTKVLLDDVLWSIAERLEKVDLQRKEVGSTPIEGAAPTEKAHRARAALEQRLAVIQEQVERLELHAGQVVEADRRYLDHRATEVLDLIAHSDDQEIALLDSQTLEALERARQLADGLDRGSEC